MGPCPGVVPLGRTDIYAALRFCQREKSKAEQSRIPQARGWSNPENEEWI
jgi:hypothetical protein